MMARRHIVRVINTEDNPDGDHLTPLLPVRSVTFEVVEETVIGFFVKVEYLHEVKTVPIMSYNYPSEEHEMDGDYSSYTYGGEEIIEGDCYAVAEIEAQGRTFYVREEDVIELEAVEQGMRFGSHTACRDRYVVKHEGALSLSGAKLEWSESGSPVYVLTRGGVAGEIIQEADLRLVDPTYGLDEYTREKKPLLFWVVDTYDNRRVYIHKGDAIEIRRQVTK